MATQNITRAQAIANIIDFFGNTDIMLAYDEQYACGEDTIEILNRMYAQITRPRTHSTGDSKAAVANREMFAPIYEHALDGQTATAKEFSKAYDISSSKASAVLKQAVRDGLMTVADGKDSKVYTIVKSA